jgi:hypothetical protein
MSAVTSAGPDHGSLVTRGWGWCMHDGDHATLHDACAYIEAHQRA